MKFKLYTINKEYVDYLRKYDKRVSIHHGDNTRPFVGIIYNYQDIDYFIPLSSKKQKFINMKDNAPTIVKLDKGYLGCALLNNMIPVPSSEYHVINIQKIEDKNYKNLLANQLSEISSTRFANELNKKFNHLIKKQEYKKPYLKNLCCDFDLLHNKAKEYN